MSNDITGRQRDIIDDMYDDLFSQGYLQKDRDTFRNFFFAPGEQGYKNRKALYDDLHGQGYLEAPTYEDFSQRIGLHAVESPTGQTTSAGEMVAQNAAPQEESTVAPTDRQQKKVNRNAVPEWKLRKGLQMAGIGSNGQWQSRVPNPGYQQNKQRVANSLKMDQGRRAGIGVDEQTGKVSMQSAPKLTSYTPETIVNQMQSETGGAQGDAAVQRVREQMPEHYAWLQERMGDDADRYIMNLAFNKAYGDDPDNFVGRIMQKYGHGDAAEQAWQEAEEASRKEFREYLDGRNKPSFSNIMQDMAGASNATGGLGQNNVEGGIEAFAAHMKYHDLKRMSDAAWNRLGKQNQQAIIGEIQQAIRGFYPNATEGELWDKASDMARQYSDRGVYDYAVAMNTPKSATEYFFKKAGLGTTFGAMMESAARVKAGSIGDMQARDEAWQRYEKDHKGAGITGTVAGMAIDPLTYASGGIGSLAAKGFMWLGGKALGTAAMRRFATTLGGRMIAGAVGGSANLGTFMGGSEAFEQARHGGYVNPNTGVITDYNLGAVAGRFGHGALMGLGTGVVAPAIGNVSDKLVRATESTAGKLGIRVGELGISTVAEGTIFSIPEWIEGKRDPMDVWTDNMAMMAGFKVGGLIKSARQRIEELSDKENPQNMAERNHNRMGFQDRLRKMLDGRPDLALSKDEKAELERRGYTDLTELVEGYKDYSETKKQQKKYFEDAKAQGLTNEAARQEAESKSGGIPWNRFTELMEDGSVSEAARAKMYYYLTGQLLPMSTVSGSNFVEHKDANGKVTGYTVESMGANGVITSKTFTSKKAATAELNRIDRQAELNTIDIGERFYNEKYDSQRMYEACRRMSERTGVPVNSLYNMMKMDAESMSDVEARWAEEVMKEYESLADESFASEDGSVMNVDGAEIKGLSDIRAEVGYKFGVDLDKAIGKDRSARSKAEQQAVEEYINRLYEEMEREGQEPVAEETIQDRLEMSNRTGYYTPDEGQQDIKRRYDVARQRLRDLGFNDYQIEYLEGLDKQGILDELGEMEGREDAAAEAVREFLDARAAYEGMVDRVQDDIDSEVQTSDEMVDQQTNKKTGMTQRATLKGGGEVFIIDGEVNVVNGEIDLASSSSDLIVFNPATGKPDMISINDLESADEPIPAGQVKQENADAIRETKATEASNRIEGVLPFQPGDKYEVLVDESPVEVTVIEDQGENVVVQFAGSAEPTVMTKSIIQDAANALRDVQIAEQAAELGSDNDGEPLQSSDTENPPAVEEEPVIEESVDEDAMPMDGEEVDWFATTPERAHRFLYEEAGLSPEEADAVVVNSIRDAEKELEKVSKKAPKPGNAAQLNKYRAEKAAHEQQVAAAQAAVDYWKGVQVTQEAIRQQAEAELLAQRAEKGKQRSEAAAQTEAEKEAQRLADREAARQEREALNGVPDVVNDKPEDARARGFRNVNGERVDRQLLTNSVGGRTGSVKFSTDVTVPSRIAVIEADELQPSHIEGQRNPLFFLDEAQPKNRTDQASDVAAEKIAKNINPEEITGDGGAYQFSAPTVNERGEVVQGNNRSSALKRMWSSGAYADSQQRYKQYLIDHAEEFGLNPQLVASMNRPVMVNEISVDDAEAIRLGQMSAKDLESGGIERIDPVTTARKLGPKMRNFASVLLSGEDENMSLAELIAANGEAAVKWLADRGVISPTQVQSAWNPAKTGLTAEAKLDLQNILRQQLFQGGVSDLPHMFEAMPAKAQKAILSTFMRDMDSADADRILPELQHAIEAWYGAASGTSDFSKATNYEAASRAMLGWTNVRNAFSGVLPSEKFSKFAIELANRLQGSSMRNMVTYFNEFYDLVQGTGVGDLFGSGVSGEKLTLAEAIAKIFNVDINETNNGQERSEDVGSDRGDGQEGRQGEPGDTAGTEPAAPGAGAPERGGRAESNDQSVAQAEAEVDTEPTDGQKEAGNYKKGHVKVDGFDISIEQPKGSVRSGVDASGKAWSQEMHSTYGYIRGTEGVDGDHIDVFLSDHLDDWNGMVYVVDQVNKDGSFDEHKVMYGFDSEQEARDAYLSNYEEGWTGLGNITGVTRDEFKKWVDSSHRKTKPFAEYKSVKVSRPIQGMEGYTEQEILDSVRDFIEQQLTDAGIEGVTIKGMALHGSRMRGDARADSDLDVVVEYEGDISEDSFFNLVNYDLNFRGPNGVIIDINPITRGKSGTLEQYMERSRRYDEEKRAAAAEATAHETSQRDLATMLADEFKGEIKQAKARVEIVAESAEEGGLEAEANVTVDGQPSNIWLVSGAGRTMDDYWKLVCIPFLDSEWQEIADLADAYNEARGKEVCRDDADAKRINFDTIDDAVDFERWRSKNEEKSSKTTKGGKFAASESPKKRIDDFGEKIGGARKDLARGRIRDAKKMSVKDLSALKKGADDILSQANILKLYKDGQMDEATARQFMAYNSVIKSVLNSGLLKNIRGIALEKYRDAAVAWEEGKPFSLEITDKDIQAYKLTRPNASDERARESLVYHITDPVSMHLATYEALNYPAEERKLGRYVIVDYSKMQSDHVTMTRHIWVKNGYGAHRGYPFSNLEDAVEKMKKLCPVVETKEKKARGEKAEHGLRVVKEGYGYYIKSRNIPGNIYLSPRFISQKQAQSYLDENLDRLKEREQRLVDALLGSNIGMAEREGVDYRDGRDVTPQDFLDEFGFRGVEFGNWVPQGERQMYLNKTYDAIKDFCAIVGISPKAFSLGGRLGLAFGARGHSKAMAHYEPAKEVINLTRMSGVGSLAHEWFHAVDNYLAKQKTGNMSDMATVTHDVVRDELSSVFKELHDVMKSMDYHRRSRSAGEYWGRTEEEFARLFENYIYNKLAAKEATSPVLVRKDVLLEDVDEQMRGRWPYPSAEENKKMEAYFDKLFDTIQERTDDNGNVVLFQKAEGSTIGKDAAEREAALRDGLVELLRGAGIEVVTDVEEGQRVLNGARRAADALDEMKNGWEKDEKIREHRVWHGSGAEFDAFDHSHMGEGEGAQAYGWGTYVTEVEDIGRRYAETAGSVRYKGHDVDELYEHSIDGMEDSERDAAWVITRAMRNMSFSRAVERASSLFQQNLSQINRLKGLSIEQTMERYGCSRADAKLYIKDAAAKAEMWQQRLDALEGMREEDFTAPSRVLYSVEIPEDTGDNYLAWDGNVSSRQHPMWYEAMKILGEQDGFMSPEEFIELYPGSEPSISVSHEMKYLEGKHSPKTVSEALHSAGFTGIVYPANYRSGGNRTGSKNYVIFDEADAQIVGREKFFLADNGEVYGFTKDGKIYIDPRIATSETPIHEYTHLWCAALRRVNPEAWSRLKEALLGQKDVLEHVKKLYPELEGDELMDEVFAHYSGRRGRERLEREQEEMLKQADGVLNKAKIYSMFAKIKSALQRFWQMSRDLFAGKTEGIDNLSAEDFADMMLNDLLNGVDPRKEVKRAQERLKQEGEYNNGTESEGVVGETGSAYNTKDGRQVVYKSLFEDVYPDDSLFGKQNERPARQLTEAERIRAMSDEELLRSMGKSNIENGERDFFTEEYDRRHMKEYNAECDRYRQMLEENEVTEEQADDMLVDIIRQWKDNATTAERTILLAQFNTINDYYNEKVQERQDREWEDDYNRENYEYIKDLDRELTEEEQLEKQRLIDLGYDFSEKIEQRQEEPVAVEPAPKPKQSKPRTSKPKNIPTALRLRPLEEGEQSHVERRYVENNIFDFTGTDKIESAADIAYIFRQLETSSVENVFLVLIKKGKPTIIHVGMGGYTMSVGNIGAGILAASAINPDHVVMLHNHPSGNLAPSAPDRKLHKKVEDIFGADKVRPSIIIDITSGKYAEFTHEADFDKQGRRSDSIEGEVSHQVYSFSKMVFDKDWDPETAFKVTDSSNIAAFVSSHRLGEHDKVSLIVLDHANHIVGNIFLPWTSLNDLKAGDIGKEVSKYIHQMGGTRGVLYGSGVDMSSEKAKAVKAYLQAGDLSLLDCISVEKGSYFDRGMLYEPDVEYGYVHDDSVEPEASDEELDAFKEGFNIQDGIARGLARLAQQNKDKVEARRNAVRAISDNIRQLQSAMRKQRNYDRYTVNAIINTAKVMLDSGLFNGLQRSEVKRLLGMVNASVGREDISRQAEKVVDLLQDHQLREWEDLLQKMLRVKASKTNSSGVQVQGALDIEGQRMVQSFKEHMDIVSRSAGRLEDENGDDTDWGRAIKDCEDRMSSNDPVVVKNAQQEYDGILLAQQWYNEVVKHDNEIKNLKAELRDAQKEVYDFERIPVTDEEGKIVYRQDGEPRTQLRKRLKPEFGGMDENGNRQPVSDENKAIKKNLKEYERSVQASIRDIKEEQVEGYRRITDAFGQGLNESARRAKEWRDAQVERVNEIHHNINSDIEGRPAKSQPREVSSGLLEPTVNNTLLKPIQLPAQTFEKILRYLGKHAYNGEGYLFNRFVPGYMRASNQEFERRYEAMQILDEKVREVFGGQHIRRAGVIPVSVHLWRQLYDLEKDYKRFPPIKVTYWDHGNWVDDELTQGEALYIYMVNKMNDGVMKLRRMGISEVTVERIKQHLDPRFIEIADWLQDEFLPSRREMYSEVYERMYGAPMPAVENYVHLVINKGSIDKDEDINNYAFDATNPSTVTGSVIKRTRNSKPIDIHTDVFDLIARDIDDMEHWAAFAEYNRDLNTMRNYGRLRNALRNVKSVEFGGGQQMLKAFDDACAVVAGSYRPALYHSKLDKWAYEVMRMAVGACIALRNFTAFKQTLSIPSFLSEASAEEFAKHTNPFTLIGSVAGKADWEWAEKNLPGFRKRWLSRQMGDPRMLKSELGLSRSRQRIAGWFSRYGMWLNARVDAAAVATGAHAVYETKKKQYLKEGYTPELAESKALADAWVAYNNSQQSTEGPFVSPVQLDKTSLSMLFTMFRTASMSYNRKNQTAARNLKYRLSNLVNDNDYMRKSIDFMKKLYEREGLGEDEAKERAERMYNRGKYKAVWDMVIYSFILTALWNMGKKFLQVADCDDEQTKDNAWRDILAQTAFGPVEGWVGGDLVSDVGTLLLTGEDVTARNVTKEQPFVTSFSRIVDQFGRDKYEAACMCVNLLTVTLTGVDPSVVTDAFVSIADAFNGDFGAAKEFCIAMYRLNQFPQKQIDEIYIDELGIWGKDIKGTDMGTLARRYADYMRHRNAPYLDWTRDDDAVQKANEKYIKKIDTKVKERLEGRGIEWLEDAYVKADPHLQDLIGKAIKKRVVDVEDEALKDLYDNSTNEATRKAAHDELRKRMGAERDPISGDTEYNKVYNRIKTTDDMEADIELAKAQAAAKAAGDRGKEKAIAGARSKLSGIRKGLGRGNDEQVMETLRNVRQKMLDRFVNGEAAE